MSVPKNWNDYELLDCGGFEKLERFGAFTIIRPEPQAIWKKQWDDKQWNNIAHARFRREKQQKSYRFSTNENGGWTLFKKMPQQWNIQLPFAGKTIAFKLSLTSFGHIGIFPEQISNWQYIEQALKSIDIEKPSVLNLFAYTGAASVIARSLNAEVTHLDAVKQIITWAKENMELSKLTDIRWIVDDALKFVKREAKRGKTYHGIILDPPAYGRGPDGEKWILEDNLDELIQYCTEILDKDNAFLILNLYSMGYNAMIAENMIKTNCTPPHIESLDLYIQSKSGIKLPLGVVSRFIKTKNAL